MTDDADQWRPPGRTTERRGSHVHLGRRHEITSPLQPGPVACFCPIARDHTEAQFYGLNQRKETP